MYLVFSNNEENSLGVRLCGFKSWISCTRCITLSTLWAAISLSLEWLWYIPHSIVVNIKWINNSTVFIRMPDMHFLSFRYFYFVPATVIYVSQSLGECTELAILFCSSQPIFKHYAIFWLEMTARIDYILEHWVLSEYFSKSIYIYLRIQTFTSSRSLNLIGIFTYCLVLQ